MTLRASDGASGTGVEYTEYRIDGGGWTRSDNTAKAEPFVTTFTVSGDGDHTVEFRSRDVSGNVQSPVGTVTFKINRASGGGGSCLPQSDEFDGTALDPKWTVTRSAGGGPTVSGGSLRLPILQGDFIANDALASNTVLQPAPDGEWTATAKLDTASIDANGEQAGLLVWKSESPNSFSKIVAIRSGGGVYQFEHIVTQSGSVNPPISSSITPAPGGALPAFVLLRARSDGQKVIGEFSVDNGDSWVLIGNAGHAAPLTGALRVGPVAFRGSQGGGTAAFDWVRLLAGSQAGGPGRVRHGLLAALGPVQRHHARSQVGGHQPRDGFPGDGQRRPSAAADGPGRSLRRPRDHAGAAAAGAAGFLGGDGQDQARQRQCRRRGGRAGADQQPQPEPLRQDRSAVQVRHRSQHGGQSARQVGGAGRDLQRLRRDDPAGDRAVAQLGRALPRG